MEEEQFALALARSPTKLYKTKSVKPKKKRGLMFRWYQIENVNSFVYLGSCFQSDGDNMADVKHRMNLVQ